MPYDVQKGMTTRGLPKPGDEAKLRPENAEFIRSRHGYEEGWLGRQMLGQGAHGRAGMWEKRDSEGSVVDVRKTPP